MPRWLLICLVLALISAIFAWAGLGIIALFFGVAAVVVLIMSLAKESRLNRRH